MRFPRRLRRDSSLLAMGRPAAELQKQVEQRFIPSCEGQTYRGTAEPACRAIHPLLRGADIPLLFSRLFDADSSPLARGRRVEDSQQAPQVRFIPSCEGQTYHFSPEFRYNAIHPLLRGADYDIKNIHFRVDDSSPLARGRLPAHVQGVPALRFIPSCEGQTRSNMKH